LVITTALLHGTGIAASRFGGKPMRIAGAAIALAGIALFAV
jgi:hydrogenase/urease accessory protein HupE